MQNASDINSLLSNFCVHLDARGTECHLKSSFQAVSLTASNDNLHKPSWRCLKFQARLYVRVIEAIHTVAVCSLLALCSTMRSFSSERFWCDVLVGSSGWTCDAHKLHVLLMLCSRSLRLISARVTGTRLLSGEAARPSAFGENRCAKLWQFRCSKSTVRGKLIALCCI